jgi:hypothetical protein
MENLRASAALGLLVAAALTAAACAARASDDEIAKVYAELSLPFPSARSVVICHGFGCNFRTQVTLGDDDRARLAALLAPGKRSPQAERKGLAAATAWFDRRVGPAAGTTRRAAFARGLGGDASQMDCIDLSSNNTSLFLILEQLHLLTHHRVEHPVSRGLLIDGRLPHTTAVLGEIHGDHKWAIDNWTHKFGEPPDVEPLDQWLKEG